MTAKARVLVMGATGQVGGALIPLLVNQADLDVVAAVRNRAKAASLSVPTVYLDLDDFASFAPALEGIDRIFMATGYTIDMLRQSKDLVNTAKRAGVKQIVHLGACGDDDTRVAHYGWHQFIERYIESSGIGFTHLRPEIFMQNLLGYGGESYVDHGVIKHYVGGARLSWVDCDDVAAVAATCLAHPAQHAGKTYRLGYEAKTYYELAEIFSETLGQTFSYEPQPPSEFLRNVLAAGAEPAYMKCVFDSYTDLTNGVDIRSDEIFDNFPRGHPEVLFRAMLRLAGALTTFALNESVLDFPAYDHNALGTSFTLLDERVRALLDIVQQSKCMVIPFKPMERFVWSAAFADERQLEASHFLVSVNSPIPVEELISKFPRLAKLSSSDELQRLISKSLPGLGLRHQPSPPASVPINLSCQYFSLSASGPLWENILRARSLSVFVPGEIAEVHMELLTVLS